MSGVTPAPGSAPSAVDVSAPPPAGPAAAAPSQSRNLLRDRPILPLLALLGILVVISQLVRPGIVTADWASVMVRAAVPLAILGACQTLAMLTGGIDLSVGAVASMSGFVVATFVASPGGWQLGIAVAIVAAIIAGLVTGVGVGVWVAGERCGAPAAGAAGSAPIPRPASGRRVWWTAAAPMPSSRAPIKTLITTRGCRTFVSIGWSG